MEKCIGGLALDRNKNLILMLESGESANLNPNEKVARGGTGGVWRK
jgi:hypothetical protein